MADQIQWHYRAALCEILALGLRYPGDDLVGALISGEYAQALDEITAASGLDESVAALLARYAGSEDQATLHALRVEHTRLFIGSPQPLISPYEGVWWALDDGVQPLLFVNPHTMDVERIYRSFGIGSPENTNEPLDHVATELEFLEYLASVEAGLFAPNPGVEVPEKGYGEAYESFMANHVSVWMPRFADAVVEQSEESFFVALASVLKAFVCPGE
ncbi:MAG: molecular chaperone TorD family protein [Raoultibacter sp.]